MMATAGHRPDRMRTNESKTDISSLPLHKAIINRDLKQLKKLLLSGDVQLHPVTKETPLHVAARSGSMECLRWLLDNNINSPFEKDRDGSTPGHFCAAYGQLEALKELLTRDSKRKHELAKSVDENGLSILAIATLEANIPIVTWILDNFPETGRIKDSNGDLPIHFAAAGGSLAIVKVYVQKFGRKYCEESDSKQIKPAYYAAQNGKLDILQYLLKEVKVQSKVRDKSGSTIMHAATTGHQLAVVKWLVGYLGPKTILSRTFDGATPLHIAAAQGYTDLLEYFIENLEDLIDINVRDDILATPAHDAAEFGEEDSFLVLLKNGADITIKDKEDKTPNDLAVEKNFTGIISMIADYREHGPARLAKYEKTAGRSRSSSAGVDLNTSSNDMVNRTSVISNVKMEATNLIERRKDESLTRQASLLNLKDEDDDGNDTNDELERQLMQPTKDRNRPYRSSEERATNRIAHELSPEGDLYAVVTKKNSKKSKNGHGSREQMSEIGSQGSLAHRSAINGFGDPGAFYKGPQHNLETASNFSRPSRVKYYDYESSSSVGSSVSQKLESGRNHVPGFYPGNGTASLPGYHKGMVPPPAMLPPGGGGYPYPNYQYPYFSAMVAQHYGYPHPQQQFSQPKPKTTGERMHMEALQKSGHPLYGPPGVGPPGVGPPGVGPPGVGYPMGYPVPYQYRQGPQPTKGQGRMRPSSGRAASTHSVPSKRHGHPRSDREIGFGPSSVSDDHIKNNLGKDKNGHNELHPPPPPITKKGKVDDQKELQSVDENFIMVQADVEGKTPTQASEGIQLHRAKIPDVYDGRYDQYIQTDSEDECILDEHISVSTLGECALILALGPISGMKGLQRLRKPVHVEKVPPAEFAELEAQKTSKQWSSRDDVNRIKEIELRDDSPKPKKTLQDWTDILGMPSDNIATPVTGQFLGGSIRALHVGMNELKASTLHQSLASLTVDGDDDDEDDIISVVVGGKKASRSKVRTDRTKESRKKSHKKSKGSQKEEPKTKKKMVVKPSKAKDKEKDREMKLRKENLSDQSIDSGPVEVKNTALFDSSDSDQGKKKRKKIKKEKVKKEKSKKSRQSDDEFDEIISKTQKEFDEIWSMYPQKDADEGLELNYTSTKPENTELERIDGMFPQHKPRTDDVVALAKLQEMWKDKSQHSPQQGLKMQMLINTILKGNDLEMKKKVLDLMSDGRNPLDESLQSSSSNSNLTAEIEAKIMEAQEKHWRETEQHFKNSESMQQRLEGEMKQYMEQIKKEFMDQRAIMQQQLEEQKKLLNKESRKKGSHYPAVSDSEDTDSFELVHPKILPGKRMMEAKADIAVQNPLKWDDYNSNYDTIIMPPNPPPLQILLSDVIDPELKHRVLRGNRIGKQRKSTSTDLRETEQAIQFLTERLTASEDSDDDEFATSIPKVATRKRADVRSSKKLDRK